MEENTNTSVVEEVGAGAQATEPTEKTFTESEVMKLVQAEADRRTNQALAKQKKEFEKKMSLSKLDDNEREKAERDNRIAELEEQLALFQIERNKSELKSVLSARGLSAEFADIIVINDDIEASQKNIDALDKLFKAAVKAEVEKRLAGNTPKGNGASSTEITRDSAKKMSMVELNKLAETNPDLFNKLFN